MIPSSHSCAAELLEVVPLIMRAMRAEVRRQRSPELSMPQFRALAFLGRNEGAALSDVATFLGLALPSASKLIDGLVLSKFVVREIAAEDRRRVCLALSPAGRAKYKVMVTQARKFLAKKVAHFSDPQRQQLSEILGALRLIFEKNPPTEVSRPNSRIAKRVLPTNGTAKRVSPTTPHHA
jgi:DNA-binding MarR family transcriptional regulator